MNTELLQVYGIFELENKQDVIVVSDTRSMHFINTIDDGICAISYELGKGRQTDWSVLEGRTVHLWPNPDSEAKKSMNALGNMLTKSYQKLNVLWISPKYDDITPYDFLKKYEFEERPAKLNEIISSSIAFGGAMGVMKRVEEVVDGKRETISLPWPLLDEATMALTPGSITLFCGDGGAAKSLALLQLCAYWRFELGKEVALYELEEDSEYHLIRAVAQMTNNAWLVNNRLMKERGEESKAIFKANEAYMMVFASMIEAAPIGALSHADLSKWVEKQCNAGKRIICIDPITAATATNNPWIADQEFLEAVRKPIVDSGASLVLVTHPKKGSKGDAIMDNLAGGSCWQRFCQTIIWLKNIGEEKEFDVRVGTLKTTAVADRVMSVIKARNGFGGGRHFAMNLKNLKLEEVGQILKMKKQRNY